MKRVHVYISGRVQGVFFRAAAWQTAVDLGLTGCVRNMADGRVEAVFEGKDRDVDRMVDWCHSGPPAARVDEVVIDDEPFTGRYQSFKVAY